MALRNIPYDEYMARAVEKATQEENENLRERCQRQEFEIEYWQARCDSVTERLVTALAGYEQLDEVVNPASPGRGDD